MTNEVRNKDKGVVTTFQIIDLPGYGYAKVNDKEKKSWLDTTQKFLSTRKSLKQLFLLIDASIPPQKIDLEMIKSLIAEKINFTIIFTKTDKATQKEKHKISEDFKKRLQKMRIPLPPLFQISNKT